MTTITVLSALETATGLDADLERTLDLIGVFAFGLSGGLLAVRKSYELVGVVALATVTALGGGVARDLILGATPPVAFENLWYLVVPLIAAAFVFVGHEQIDRRLRRSVMLFDAAGLGLFCVTGAVKAAAFGVSAVGAVLIGVISAVGGGIIRDVLADEQPSIFRPESTLYSIPAAVGATAVVVTWNNDWYSGTIAIVTAVGVFALRVAAMYFDWRAPKPVSRSS
jgi:uncharacterized membrane protein YeiH